MSKCIQRMGWSAVLCVGLLATGGSVQAQGFQPNPNVVSGMNQAQYMAYLQQAAAARAAAQGPLFNPSMFPGQQNPYSPVQPGQFPGAGATNPYNPVLPGSSPYDQIGYGNPYVPYLDAGGVLRGQADVMRAYGNVITSQEQARLMREQALQARLDTKKRAHDLDLYIKATTPTYTEIQAKIAKMTLRRIQTNSSEPEIVNGKALNLLLDDLRKYPGKRAAIEPFPLSEETLNHLNVTKGYNSLGILRNGGELSWPIVFQELFPADQLKLIDTQAKTLVRNAEKGKVDVNILKDMRTEIDRIREQLSKKVNEIPTTQYLEGKRFLNDFDDARAALERGEAMTQVSFQKWATGGKQMQQLVDYMILNGLKFTTATQGDEFAYRAVYSGMAALDVAVNAAMVGGVPEQQGEPKEP